MGTWGWHVPDPEPADGEHIVLRERANRFQGRRAVGGALYVTTDRLAFRPHRFDHVLRGLDRGADDGEETDECEQLRLAISRRRVLRAVVAAQQRPSR